MNAQQEKVIKLLKQRTPKEQLRPWVKGFIPSHYKRLSVDMDEAIELATEGAAASMAYFGASLFFTQSLIVGAALSPDYDHLVIVTPSQYGKSWTLGQIAILLANRGEPGYVAGANTNTTEIIMSKVIEHLQTADQSIKSKILETPGKLEKLQTSTSKRKISLKGGGSVESMSLGETYSDAKKGNSAIGRSGNFFLDEASQVSDDVYAELGRREFSQVSGEKFLSIEISNPHNPGRFFDTLTEDDLAPGTLVIWMDVLTALEEARFVDEAQIVRSEFFKNKSTCTRYLLCELEDYSEESMFPPIKVDDSAPSESCMWYAGVDSAERGKDNIEITIGALDAKKGVRPMFTETISKSTINVDGDTVTDWQDGETADAVIERLALRIRVYGVRVVCVDIGYGLYIVEGLIKALPGVRVVGVNFGSGTTKVRRELKHHSAVYGDNRRAEMHMDVQNLMDDDRMWFTSDLKDKLKDQMRAVRAIRKPNGKTAVIPKKDIRKIIGRSPDTLDSVLLFVHAVVIDSLGGDMTEIYGEEQDAYEYMQSQ